MKNALIFVYNANSGIKNSIVDGLHKVISPSTYSCDLCNLTYGYFSKKEKWDAFLKTINVNISFLYKNQWNKQYSSSEELPVVFIKEFNDVKVFISSTELNQMTLDDLISKIKTLE